MIAAVRPCVPTPKRTYARHERYWDDNLNRFLKKFTHKILTTQNTARLKPEACIEM